MHLRLVVSALPELRRLRVRATLTYNKEKFGGVGCRNDLESGRWRCEWELGEVEGGLVDELDTAGVRLHEETLRVIVRRGDAR